MSMSGQWRNAQALHGVSAYEDHHYLTLTSAHQHADTTVDGETHAGEST
jgi:hypothetical protein